MTYHYSARYSGTRLTDAKLPKNLITFFFLVSSQSPPREERGGKPDYTSYTATKTPLGQDSVSKQRYCLTENQIYKRIKPTEVYTTKPINNFSHNHVNSVSKNTFIHGHHFLSSLIPFCSSASQVEMSNNHIAVGSFREKENIFGESSH
jgi:hypothetical protein